MSPNQYNKPMVRYSNRLRSIYLTIVVLKCLLMQVSQLWKMWLETLRQEPIFHKLFASVMKCRNRNATNKGTLAQQYITTAAGRLKVNTTNTSVGLTSFFCVLVSMRVNKIYRSNSAIEFTLLQSLYSLRYTLKEDTATWMFSRSCWFSSKTPLPTTTCPV